MWSLATLGKIQRNRGSRLIVCSLDIKKFFDMVEWSVVVNALENFGAEVELVSAVARELQNHTLTIGMPGGDVVLNKKLED